MEQSEVVESKKIVKIRQKPKTQKQILENNKQNTRKIREDASVNAVAPLPTRTLNEPVFQEKEQRSRQSSPQPTLEKEEENPVTLPPSQKNKPEVILDDVLAAVPVNSNDFKRKKEKIESEILDQNDDYDFLYPHCLIVAVNVMVYFLFCFFKNGILIESSRYFYKFTDFFFII